MTMKRGSLGVVVLTVLVVSICLFGVSKAELSDEEGKGAGGDKGPTHVDFSMPYLLGYIHNDNGHCNKEPTGLLIQPSRCIQNSEGQVFYATCNSTHWVRGNCELPKHKSCPKAGKNPTGLCGSFFEISFPHLVIVSFSYSCREKHRKR